MTVQLDTRLEEELSWATRQSKVLDDKVRYLRTGGKVPTQEERLIECLTKEYNNVLTDLCTANGATSRKNDDKLFCVLTELMTENEELTQRIKIKKNEFALICDDIFKINKKVLVVRAKTLTDVQHMERVLRGQQNLRCLEYKLDIANKTYGSVITENNSIRQEIEHLLIERTSFNKLWFGYISNLQQGKLILMDMVEQATLAYNSRDECIIALTSLRNRATSDLRNNIEEMDSMQKQLDEQKLIEEFLAVKNQKRFLIGLEQKKMKKRRLANAEMLVKLLIYKKTLAEIKIFTQLDVEQDYKSFIDRYYAFEKRNMSLFLYINDLHKDIEDLLTMTLAHKINIDAQRELNKQQAKKQANTLKSLKIELASGKAEVRVFASSTTLHDFLGNNISINDYNVLLFYQILEDQVDNLILNVYLKQTKQVKTAKKQQERLIKDNLVPSKIHKVIDVVRISPCPLCVDKVMVKNVIDTVQFVNSKPKAEELLNKQLKLPEGLNTLHNVSACHLPKSRAIIQRRFY
ncbi:hypothetical protein RN001_010741 [Aquatica leii]|uniref:ODAD1 central coiled coil region domain-containing protein n=1 Tax=Aquatica leii TaxID=1421715 RepID=A0AAN7SQG6_9COLE|nr:hypothetical protein RN001_010741 [Aquatica leii]